MRRAAFRVMPVCGSLAQLTGAWFLVWMLTGVAYGQDCGPAPNPWGNRGRRAYEAWCRCIGGTVTVDSGNNVGCRIDNAPPFVDPRGLYYEARSKVTGEFNDALTRVRSQNSDAAQRMTSFLEGVLANLPEDEPGDYVKSAFLLYSYLGRRIAELQLRFRELQEAVENLEKNKATLAYRAEQEKAKKEYESLGMRKTTDIFRGARRFLDETAEETDKTIFNLPRRFTDDAALQEGAPGYEIAAAVEHYRIQSKLNGNWMAPKTGSYEPVYKYWYELEVFTQTHFVRYTPSMAMLAGGWEVLIPAIPAREKLDSEFDTYVRNSSEKAKTLVQMARQYYSEDLPASAEAMVIALEARAQYGKAGQCGRACEEATQVAHKAGLKTDFIVIEQTPQEMREYAEKARAIIRRKGENLEHAREAVRHETFRWAAWNALDRIVERLLQSGGNVTATRRFLRVQADVVRFAEDESKMLNKTVSALVYGNPQDIEAVEKDVQQRLCKFSVDTGLDIAPPRVGPLSSFFRRYVAQGCR
jgi:hypothetical protein